MTNDEAAREAVIQAIARFEHRLLNRRRGKNRHFSSPQYRDGAIKRTKKWNTDNPDRKRANDTKWAKKHGAAASKRYRDRKKQEKKNNGSP